MPLHPKSLIIGFVSASILLIGGVAGLFYFLQGQSRPVFHEQTLPSGKSVKVTSCMLVWGVEHDERRTGDDQFQLEYVTTTADGNQEARDRETLEVFELIRPSSELWGFTRATVSAFPSVERKGKYDTYSFTRSPVGKWTFTRQQARVFIND